VRNNQEALREAAQRDSRGTPAQNGSCDPTIWEYTLGDELSKAREACLRGLRRIPGGLGRLAYLTILERRVLEDHKELFREWLCCSLQQKHDWMYRLLVSASHAGTLPDEWLSRSIYFDLIPRRASKAERELYLADIDAVLDILRTDLMESPERPHSDVADAVPVF
jgi:hypothetical protein